MTRPKNRRFDVALQRCALASGMAIALQLSPFSAYATCTPSPSGGSDVISCDDSAPDPSAGLDLTGGGNDQVTLDSGTIDGNVAFGSGNDTMIVNDGTVTGSVTQGNGTDTFIMNGGTIASLSQGSGLDTAVMNGGRIIGLFFAGDFFTMTGGQIGEVNLEQANNEMRMSGGIIDGDVRAAQGNDLLELSGGSIGGNVNLGNGNNTIVATGGSIGGDVLTGNGVDTITVDGATIGGSISSGAGNDQVTVASGSVGGGIDTGEGNDGMTLSGGTVTGTVLTGLGNDDLIVTGGSLIGDAQLGDGADSFDFSGGTIDGLVNTGAGDDAAVWSGGSFFDNGDGLDMDIGSDTLLVTGSPGFTRAQVLDGGDDSSDQDGWIDVLTFDSAVGRIPARTLHWERVDIVDSSALTYGGDTTGEITEIDSAQTTIDDTSSLTADPGAGDLIITGDVDNDGTIDASDGTGAIDIGGDLDNSGVIDLSDSGGGLVIDGSTTNTGTIDSSTGGGDTSITGDLDNSGTIDISDGGGDLGVDGSATNTGIIDASGGGGDIAITGDLDNSGTIDLSGGDNTLDVDGGFTNTGTIEGGGGDTTIISDGGLINDGIIDLIDGSTGDDMTIVGPIDGSGTIEVDVDITETGGTADVIDVVGDIDGDTSVVINNTGMPLTGTPSDGSGATILTAEGSVDGTFAINEPFNYMPIGPWRYELANDGSSVRLEAVFDGEQLAALAPSSAAAIIGPESVLAGTQQFLPNIREREGQAVLVNDGRGEMWVRVLGSNADLDGKGYDVGYDADTTGVQAAVGYVGDAGASGQFKAGVTAGVHDGRWEPELRSARADLDVDGHAYGLYATWFQDAAQTRGWYVDAIAQVSDFDLDIRIPVSPIASYDGKGWGVAAEVGYLHRWHDWRVEPQGRLVYLRSDIDGFTGLDGLEAQANENDRLLARIGVRLSREYAMDRVTLVPAYKAAVWQRLSGDDDVTVGFQQFQSNMPDTVGEIGIGLDVRGRGNLAFYAQLDARFGSDFTEYNGELGLRLRW